MSTPAWQELTRPQEKPSDRRLDDGSRVAVVGGGPAGSLFATFVLDLAQTVGTDLTVDIFEPRDFERPGPTGCNMCGGIVSETLVQNLATEGINLPPTVVQRGINSYVLHMDVGSVRLATPRDEMRIAAMIRGGGPRGITVKRWDSFDRFLIQHAQERGARVIDERVVDVGLDGGRPRLATKKMAEVYDLVAVAIGVNSPTLDLFESLGLGYRQPTTTRTLIREYHLGQDVIEGTLGPSMHVFLLNIPRLQFAAIIPKGDYVTMCLLGESIDQEIIDMFTHSREVQSCMPEGWQTDERSCQCTPRMNIHGVEKPFADHVVFLGDCGVTRLYKDGIGAAYRTAKAAARSVVFEGVSEDDLRRHFLPACRKLTRDNFIGKLTFAFTKQIQRRRFARRAIFDMTVAEQSMDGHARRMSSVLWDMFTGSAPYTDVFLRTLHPVFVARLGWFLLKSMVPRRRTNRQPGGT
jgi:flavin-dependent dehydrogenase